ncbi:ROK family protein [uncultured Bacteroides sp.]|uniref:ROK family protein n=1 Tax=uncultured Bacteroides sp. TaxID=162156 RepID=UPI002AAC41C4|nr:ROK family protein [uncultured Bacteroides sp.]
MTLSKLFDSQEGMALSALKMARLKKSVIQQLMLEEGTTIADICKETEFSVPTVTKVVVELIEEGIAFEKGKIDTAGGRRPSIYCINPNSAFFLGVDVRRDCVSIGLQNFKNEFLELSTRIDFVLKNTQESLHGLCHLINEFIDKSGLDKSKILGACVVLSGRTNSAKGYSDSYFSSESEPLSNLIESRIGIKTFIENDSRAMGYGEYCCGAGALSSEKDVIYISLNWGFGISMICNGMLYYGMSGFSGEFGHSPVLDNQILCQCGKKGCLETEISGQALVRRFKEKLAEGSTSIVTSQKEVNNINMYDIIRAATKHEDLLAIEVIEEVGEKLGHYMSLLLNIFNPELVILGGEMADCGTYLTLPIETALHKYSLNLVLQDMKLKIGELGDKAGVIGGCYILRDRLFGIIE